MSKPTECIMPDCPNKLQARGLCRTHLRHLYESSDLDVQKVVEEHERSKQLEVEYDWDYLTEDQRSAIERGVRDACWDTYGLQGCDLEDMLQEAWIWAASHKTEVQGARSMVILRRHMKRRAIELHKTQWSEDRELDYFEDFLREGEDR